MTYSSQQVHGASGNIVGCEVWVREVSIQFPQAQTANMLNAIFTIMNTCFGGESRLLQTVPQGPHNII